MPRYTFSRNSIVSEFFEVQAATEQQALEMVQDGHPRVKIVEGEWIDWAETGYHLVDVEDEMVLFTKGENVNG